MHHLAQTLQPAQGQHYLQQLGLNTQDQTRLSFQQSSHTLEKEHQVHQLMKQVKVEKAQFTKKQALLEQQIELLKLQVQEATARETTQKVLASKM
jgi:hypothetical protein